MKKQLTAWLSIGSTYTYLTALRLERVIARHDVDILVKPISIRSIMKEMDNSPFPPSKPEKVKYMWRDIERRAAVYGLPTPKVPAPYPLEHFDRANLFGVVMAKQGIYVDYLKETCEQNTKEARQFGIFGVPSFSINDEIFWGDDRLEDAILFQP